MLVSRRVGVDDLVSQRLLLGDPAADAGPGREVVDAYARLVDYLLERVPAAAGPRSERRARAGRDMAASLGPDASHLCASILPGSETSQRSHTIWHETVLSIDSRATP